jgi:hypothetical protein
MKIHKLIDKSLRAKGIAAQVSGAIDANIGERGRSVTHLKSHHRIVQQGGKTIVDEHEVTTDPPASEPDTTREGEPDG